MSPLNGALVRFGFRHAFHGKTFWAAVAIAAIPVLAGLLLLITDGIDASRAGSDYEFHADVTEWLMFFALGGTIPLMALVMAGGLLADEGQDRTLSYLITRPIPRVSLYLSKFIPVATILAVLAAAQVLLFGLLRLASLAIQDPGARTITQSSTTVSTAGLIATVMVAGMGAAVLVAVGYCAIFAFVSMVVQRFHFMVNLLYYLVWELPFASLGGAGFGFFTVLYHGQSIVSSADASAYNVDTTSPWVSAPWLLLGVTAWLALGAWRVQRQDFHVTSAAT